MTPDRVSPGGGEQLGAEHLQEVVELGPDWAAELSDWALDTVINAASREVVLRAATRRATLGEQVDAQLAGALESRSVIAQATGFLVERLSLAPEAAFTHLVELARASRLTVSQVAVQLVGSPRRPALTPQIAPAAPEPEGTVPGRAVPERVAAPVRSRPESRVRVAALVDAADARDQAASLRDRAGRQRDQAATDRDTSALQGEASAQMRAAASAAQGDRREADLDRSWAGRDRDEAAADRGLLVEVVAAAVDESGAVSAP